MDLIVSLSLVNSLEVVFEYFDNESQTTSEKPIKSNKLGNVDTVWLEFRDIAT